MRSRPWLVSLGVALATTALAASAFTEPVRLAQQRWTPLTGVLTPEGEADSGANSSDAEQPPQEPAEENSINTGATGLVATSALTLRLALTNTVTNGTTHGGLGVKTTAVDGDLAQALKLGGGRGAMVTEIGATSPDGDRFKLGDIIQRVAGTDVAGPDALLTTLKTMKPGQQVSVDIRRAGGGASDLKRFLIDQADAGNVGAAASLGRLMSLGLVFGPRDFPNAGRYYLRAAEAGHLASMTRYALFAKDGIGMARDEALAVKWFRKAAEGGQDAAMTNLGSLYETGRGVKQDFAEAARWYRQAVDKGHVFAMHRLGLLYEAGRGVKKDDQEAVRLLEQASEKGLSEATAWLADKYEQGRGIPKNQTEANRLHARAAEQVRVAAEQNNAVATFNLGILYRLGKGVKKSDTEAAYWVVRSLRLGDKYLVGELMRNPNVLSLPDRKWLQEVLRGEGVYKGPINGTFSPEVRTAMESLANRA